MNERHCQRPWKSQVTEVQSSVYDHNLIIISLVTLSMAVVVPCFDREPDWRKSKRLKLSQ
jgi:hypothetical protein